MYAIAMATTLNLDEDLARAAESVAARCGETLSEFVERLVREALEDGLDAGFVVSSATGGLKPGLSFDRFDEIVKELDEQDAVDKFLRADP